MSAGVAYLVFTACSIVYLIPFMRTLYVESDEGLFFCGAARILQGQVFARDFLEIMGPGSFYWMAAFFKLFGVTFFAARLSILIPFLGTLFATYWLSRRFCARYQALPCLLLAGPYFGLFGQIESHHADSVFFALLTTVCLIFWKSRNKAYLLFAAGGLAGITTCFLQPMGVVLFFACLIWVLAQCRNGSQGLSRIGPLILGSLTVGVVVVTYFWREGALGGLYYANYYVPTHAYGPANTVPYAQRLNDLWYFLAGQSRTSGLVRGIAAVAEVPGYFIAALPALLLLLAIPYKWKSIPQEVVLLWLSGGAIWFAEYHRSDIHHLAYGSPLLTIVCFHMLDQIKSNLIRIAVWMLAACAICFAFLNFIVSAQVRSVPTRAGQVAAFGPGSGRALTFLMEHTQPGENILVYPCAPSLYFLSATTNPTPYTALFYGQTTPEQFQKVLGILETQKVQYVVWDTQLLAKRASGGIMRGLTPTNPGEISIEPYLLSHYSIVVEDGDVRVLKRKGL